MAELDRWEDFDHEQKLKQISSSIQSQDVSHVLTKLFKERFSKSFANTEIIKNQVNSKGSDDPYHERYVAEMQKVFQERDKRMSHITNLERYIIKAQAKTLSADEKMYNNYSTALNVHPQIYSCIDLKMLKDNGLLTPDDYAIDKQVTNPSPQILQLSSSSKQPRKKSKEKKKFENSTFMTCCSEKLIPEVNVKKETLKKDNQVFPTVNAWKDYPSVEEREKEKKILSKMVHKLNYLRNPRHQPHSLVSEMTSLIHQKKSSTETAISPTGNNEEKSPIFIPIPNEIVFKEYEIGKVYEAILELKNVSSVLRPCRVLPPASKYFTIGLGQYPGDHGLVAPGISCIYTIRFAPDSLGDFKDELKIITQASNPISVPLFGKRPHPILTLPAVIDLGYCLVGDIQVTQVVIKNKGGHGCFCLLPESTWSTTNFRTAVHEETVSIPPFVVRPSTFEMKNGQVGVLEIVFKPKEVQTYQEKVTILCDNCQVKHCNIVGTAQKAKVSICPSKDVYTEPATDEKPDESDKHFINFETLNIFTYTEKNFTVKNCTNINLPYYWDIKTKTMDGRNDESSSVNVKPLTPFCIYPTYGIFSPEETIYFEAVFAPEKINSYTSVLQMILENVPNQQNSDDGNSFNNTEENPSQKENKGNGNDFVGLSITLQGQCDPYSVMLRPYGIFIHGLMYNGITERRDFSLINNSISVIKFHWESCNNDFYILEVIPSQGVVDPIKEVELQLCITGCRPGPIDYQLACYLEYQEEPICLNVQAEIKGADVRIEDPNVDFGLICCGNSATKEITLHNRSPIQAEFSIKETTESDNDLTELQIVPDNGTLQPLESCKVSISYTADNVLSFTKYISVQVVDSKESNMLVFGEVQSPNVVLKSCQIYMEDVYHGVPARYQVTLVNNTLLPTQFQWQEVFGNQCKFCDVQLVPDSGSIGAREEQDIEVIFTAHKKMLFDDIYICCQIEGMKTQLCLSLSGDVLGVKVEYNISHESFLSSNLIHVADTEKIIKFGDSIQLNSLSNMYVHIFNDSAIDTTFDASIKYFPARLPSPPTPEENEDEEYKSWHSRRSKWKKLNHKQPSGTFLTSLDSELMNYYLGDNNGAAFLITPANGQLLAYNHIVLQISAINNMWGQYLDTFCCQIDDLEPIEIPIELNVVGTPLKFLLVGPNTTQAPQLRFGSHLAGSDSMNRKLRISNTSPFDIRVDWLAYNSCDDDKLLDFKVIIGDPFPILGENGLEICPRPPESSLRENHSISIMDTKGKEEKLIRTLLQIHDGNQSDKPFTIIPKQMVIKANSNSCLQVHFTPSPVEEVTNECNCISFGRGYLHLAGAQKNDHSSRISRPQGYDISPLDIHMTAQILPAQLFVDFMGEDKLYFECGLGELLEDKQLCESKLRTSSFKLINQTQAAMSFTLSSKHPFQLIPIQQSISSIKSKHQTNSFTLHPQKHLTVKVSFTFCPDIVNWRQRLEVNNDAGRQDGISLKTVGSAVWVNFLSSVTIQFNNESTQTIDVEADIALPDFEISTAELDFGICWIGHEILETFTLTNISQTKSFFFINVDVLCGCCDASVFRVEPDSGYLDAHDFWRKINVNFKAKKFGRHQAELSINGIMGEKKLTIFMKGYGSHDERHCSIHEG